MYIKSVEGFEGEGEFMSRFGLQIQDQMVLTVARRKFQEEIEEFEPEITRPREGDLIFLPWVKGSLPTATGALFEIKFVNHDAVFYQMGDLQTYDITLERFNYSEERLDTGVALIDNIEVDNSQDYQLDATTITTEAGVIVTAENGVSFINDNYDKRLVDKDDDSTMFEDTADGFIDFSDINPFSEGVL